MICVAEIGKGLTLPHSLTFKDFKHLKKGGNKNKNTQQAEAGWSLWVWEQLGLLHGETSKNQNLKQWGILFLQNPF